MDKGDLKKRDIKDLKDEFKIPAAIRFTEKNESKFFKLIAILVKNSESNLRILQRFKPNHMQEYKEKIIDLEIWKITN